MIFIGEFSPAGLWAGRRPGQSLRYEEVAVVGNKTLLYDEPRSAKRERRRRCDNGNNFLIMVVPAMGPATDLTTARGTVLGWVRTPLSGMVRLFASFRNVLPVVADLAVPMRTTMTH